MVRLLLASLLLSACGSARDHAPRCAGPAEYVGSPARRDAPALDGAQARPIAGALAPTQVAALEAALDELLRVSGAPAVSAAYAVPGVGMWSGERGLARTTPPTPVSAGAKFQAASVGKLFTAVLVLRQVERGALRLDDRASRWFPAYPGAQAMTVEQLLTHTGGSHSFNADPAFDRALRYQPPAALLERAAGHPNLFCPGTQWGYSNTGYVMLGQIVEALSGHALADEIEGEIAAPLQLRSTVARRPGDARDDVVTGHVQGVPRPDDVDYATPHGAGLVAASAGDLVRVLHAVLAGELLAPATVDGMLRGMYPMFGDPRLYYGRGLMLYDAPDGPGVMIGHSGGMPGFRAIVAYLPAEPAYVAVIFNDERPAEAGLWLLVQAARGAATSR